MENLGWLKEAVRPYYLRWLYFPLRPGRRPPAFEACWRFPYDRIGGSVRLPQQPSPLPVLLFYPMTDWHTRIQRTQHLVRAFAALGFRCIYINPHLGREFETTALSDKHHRLAQLEPNIFELHIRLPREPVFHDRLLTPVEEEIIAGAIRRVLPESQKGVIQMLSFPLWQGVAARFRREDAFPLVYDCHDLLSGFDNICSDMIAAETSLLQTADLVLFSSQGLLERYGNVRKRLLVRNAVTAGQFAQTAHSADGPPVVGYVGALDSWFDIEAVEQTALLNPHSRVILAGSVEFEPIRRLQSIPNVELLGEIPYGRVPELLAQFRVAIIPFRINPLTLMTNPIKLYEYFSCGLPVITTPLPEAQAMGDLVYVGTTPPEFARQVTRALAENDPARRSRRREVAENEDWTARAREISAAFGAILECQSVPLGSLPPL
jgi:glycosyltransferase involved in cell wall biosynthesis